MMDCASAGSSVARVSELDQRAAPGPEPESGDNPAKVPLTARLLLRDSLTARRAAAIIAAFTLAITVAGGILERLLDHKEYPTIGKGLWFALQTVTTVGYGDVTPRDSTGRFIAAVVMLSGIGFLAVITAAATASLIEGSRRRFAAQSEAKAAEQLDEIGRRLVRIEQALDQRASGGPSDGVG
jgi:voltage-gated potassium channel